MTNVPQVWFPNDALERPKEGDNKCMYMNMQTIVCSSLCYDPEGKFKYRYCK